MDHGQNSADLDDLAWLIQWLIPLQNKKVDFVI